MQIATPIPDRHLAGAARLWWGAFAPPLRGPSPPIRASHGIAAIGPGGSVAGVAGFRDHEGGLLSRPPVLARLLFRPAPPTGDLVIDGIVVDRLRHGTGRALLDAAARVARRAGRPALRAEVELRNRPAMAFYAATGFAEIGRGDFGWPWSGPVAILRRPL
ncbi:GNAT family N-acetyltransferase [Paracoccus sediminis]|uniref:Acetyltransferase (GNAT) family protein n=1 Tax=Paracoccus sediminis TaxID=1214787 RepID=A0A238VYU4_9RHOB|nr:GNAT family N-acetyltransferase [Paracoccus sediminis]SNR39500.1 Acetyltransferase (GNAT) family protein [Paracoccus sediminis]